MNQVITEYSLAQRQSMLHIARDAIMQGLANKSAEPALQIMAQPLQERRASFVTLNIDNNLRGCIGSLKASRPLIIDIFHNARAAAFQDTRFSPLTLEELPQIAIHISVLTEAVVLQVDSRADLLKKIQPGLDGLILQENGKRATFLPSVWQKIPDKQNFISQLRRKAGLDPQGWSTATQVFNIEALRFPECELFPPCLRLDPITASVA